MKGFGAHAAALALFAVLAVLFTDPLIAHVGTAVLGAPGDNFSFLWNFWWAKTAVASHQSPLSTPMLFAPIGTSLATHTYVPLMTVAAAYLFPATAPGVLYDGAVLLAVFLNFACAHLAAFTITRDRRASVFAGIAFGGSPFLIARAGAHLNVLSAWGLPLTLAAVVRFTRRPTTARSIWMALALAAVAYTDYYYVIFGAVMAAMMMSLSIWRISIAGTPLTPVRRRAAWTLAALLLVVLALAAAITMTGGTDTSIGPIRLRMTDTFNLRVIAGFLLLSLLVVWKRPRVHVLGPSVFVLATPDGRGPGYSLGFVGTIRALIPGAVLGLVLIAPLVIATFQVWRAGDYTTQSYAWRSAPPGIDVATLFMGNPLHPVTGSLTEGAFRHLGINGVEGAAWLGVAPMALLLLASRQRRDPLVAACFWIAGVFFVWSLGPYLRVLGYNTAVMLPQTALRYVPIAANARIPGRAFTVVQLMAAMLGAIALASANGPAQRKHWLALAAIAATLIDFAPGRRPTTALDAPRVYEALRGMPQGIVLNVPLGIRDGLGARGNPQEELLFYQTVHGHPQMGGFVARLSARITSTFDNDAVLSALLDLSEGRDAKSPAGPCRDSLACDARYIVVDERAASPALQQYVRVTFPEAEPRARDSTVALYVAHGQGPVGGGAERGTRGAELGIRGTGR